MKLTICTFLFAQPRKWRRLFYDHYYPKHVNALWRACADLIKIPHKFIAFTDSPDGIECERRPSFDRIFIDRPGKYVEDGCYQRLRIYDPVVQAELGTEWVLMLDLDIVLMQDCTSLIEDCMNYEFTTLRGSQGGDGSLCNYYNGSFQLCKSGTRPQLWRDFNPRTFYHQREAYRLPNGKRPLGTDQAWFCVALGGDEHVIGEEHGVYQYRTLHGSIPDDARMLMFSGRRKPWDDECKVETPKVAAQWAKYAA